MGGIVTFFTIITYTSYDGVKLDIMSGAIKFTMIVATTMIMGLACAQVGRQDFPGGLGSFSGRLNFFLTYEFFIPAKKDN